MFFPRLTYRTIKCNLQIRRFQEEDSSSPEISATSVYSVFSFLQSRTFTFSLKVLDGFSSGYPNDSCVLRPFVIKSNKGDVNTSTVIL